MLKTLMSKAYSFVAILTLLTTFAWLTYVTSFLTASYDVIALFSIDETIFHLNLLEMREALAAHDWKSLLSNTGYGYGNIYWTPLVILTWPLFKWGTVWLTIITPRMFSVIGLAMCFLASYKITRKLGAQLELALASLLIPLSTSGIFFAAPRFHNHTIHAALFLWSLYFLIKPVDQYNRAIACTLCGLMLGMKISGLFYLPIFFLFWNSQVYLRELSLQSIFKSNIKALVTILVIAVMAISPTIWLMLFKDDIFMDRSIGSIVFVILQQKVLAAQSANFLKDCWENVIGPFYHWLIFALGISLSFLLIFKKRSLKLKDNLVPLSSLLSIAMATSMIFFSMRQGYFVRFYLFPFIFLFPLIFVEITKTYQRTSFLFLIALSNVFLLKDSLWEGLTWIPQIETQQDVKIQLKRFPELEKIQFETKDIVYMDYNLIFPFKTLQNLKNVRYVYEGIFTPSDDGNIYIFPKNANHIDPAFIKTQSHYLKIYEDSDIMIVRRN